MSNLYIGGYSNNVDIYNETFENSFVYGGGSKVTGEINIKNLCLFGYDNEVSSPTDGSATLIGDSIFISGYQNKISAEATSKWLTNGLTIVGHLNNDKQTDGLFIVGNGAASGPGTYNRSNCFRVADTQVFGGTYKSSGADYAELFEWLDGNPDGEDRAGRFVTLDGDKLRLATPEDDFILGIVSGNPSIVGDVHDDQWHGMYQQDIFGRYIWEDVEIPEETEEKPDPKNPDQTIAVVKRPAHTERRRVVNPDYDPDQKYTPRSERPEWDAVGMMGKLVAVDDGSCQAGGYCSVGPDGAATHSAQRTGCRVMKRLDETHVLLLVL